MDTIGFISFFLHVCFGVSIGLLLLISSFVMFPLVEMSSGMKNLQRVMRVGPITYWLSYFLWDFTCYFFVAFIITCLIPAFDKSQQLGNLDALSMYIFHCMVLS